MASSPLRYVSSEELAILADRLGGLGCSKLGELLGLDRYTVYGVTREGDDQALYRLLQIWRDEQEIGSDIRSCLAQKLRFDYPVQSSLLLNAREERGRNPERAPDIGLSDRVIADIAEDIETDDQMEKLGRSLRIPQAAINRHLATNRVEGRVGFRGTRDMLFGWRQTTAPADHEETLRNALRQSGLVFLAHKHLGDFLVCEDIDDRRISSAFTVGMCRQELISQYRANFCKVQIKPWERFSKVDVKDIYTVVTMYKQDAHGGSMGEQEKVVLEGSVNDIFKTQVNGMLPARIVVFAAAGKGKTTAIAKLADDWVSRVPGTPLKDLPLLFILKLRNVHREASLGQAIISELLSDVEDITPASLERFIRNNQELCWLILDGLDEYGGNIASIDDAQGSNIIRVLHCTYLRKMRILVTSRPHVEKELMQGDVPSYYAKMEIEGFSDKNSREYITRFFRHDVVGESLKTYLEQNHAMNELVRTPLFCLMICYLWRENLLSGIDTQTKLFNSITDFLWQHAQARGGKYTTDWLHKTLESLGKVALGGLLDDSNKLLFTCDDFKGCQDAINDGCTLGLISQTKSYYWTPLQSHTEKTSIEFYHKLAQEHCAAAYLTKKHEQASRAVRVFKVSKLDRVLRIIQTKIAQYEHLVRFVGGRSDATCVKVMGSILANRSLSKRERYRMLLDCSSESSDLTGSLSSIVGGCIEDGSVDLRSPTIYTAIGMKKLPISLREEIKSIDIDNACLTTSLANTLTSGFRSLPRLQEVTITKPTLVQGIPTLQAIRRLKLVDLPKYVEDWKWIADIRRLDEIDVSFKKDSERLHFHGGKAELQFMSAMGTLKLVYNIPRYLQKKVISARIGTPLLNPEQILGVIESLRTFSNLQNITIENPPAFNGLRYHSSLRSVKLRNIPREVRDWSWVANNSSLEEIFVSIEGVVDLPASKDGIESLSIHNERAAFERSSIDGTLGVIEHIPKDVYRHVRDFSANGLISHDYKVLIAAMPLLKTVTCKLANPDADSAQIARGLRHTGGSLTGIHLDGKGAVRWVSDASMNDLCDLIMHRATNLEKISMEHMEIDQKSLVNFVKTCRAITTIMEITVCLSKMQSIYGALHNSPANMNLPKYLASNQKSHGTVKVNMRYYDLEGKAVEKTFRILHAS